MMYGADSERLMQGAVAMRRAADDIDGHSAWISRTIDTLAWFGNIAGGFVGMVTGVHLPRMVSTASFLREAAVKLEKNAHEQTVASAAGTGGLAYWMTKLPSPFGAGIDRQTPHPGERNVTNLADYLERQKHLPQNEFEIMKVSDNPPRYVVNLPGIEWGEGHRWENNHLRDLRGASEARVTGHDAYAERVKFEMQRAGIPAGAEVMLVGHSYGAIAAMDIASDHSFNRPGGPVGSEYSVKVTHVLAAGAGLRDRLGAPPAGTKVLMAINRNDVVASAIQNGDLDPTTLALASDKAVVEGLRDIRNGITHNLDHKFTMSGSERGLVEFSTNADALGHAYGNYEQGLNGMGNGADWFVNDVSQKYFAGQPGMQSVSVTLPDRI